ncbi:ABC transporter ATP-binding protein [Nocardia sp. NPDC051750]|uniref:ABC transporter ATP-binding protein n=1 Tax=Nocardia sp. NPDC051750 TaxID=3364325 RepID=UPI00379999FB
MSVTGTPDAVEVRGLTVRRGKREVLHDISLRIPRGSITGLLGPSGCGKTTLMRSIVGTQVVAAGEVTVLGSPAGSARLRRRIGYVTQAPSIYGDISVRDNVAYFAALYGMSGSGPEAVAKRHHAGPPLMPHRHGMSGSGPEDAAQDNHPGPSLRFRRHRGVRDAVDAALGAVGLLDHQSQRGDELSGGQRTRASLACALVAAPELLVLDEPTVGLDPVLRVELWKQFRELAAGGTTLVVSSHVMDEAEHCDRLVLMREGHLLAELSPDELRERTGEQNLEQAFLTLITMGAPA